MKTNLIKVNDYENILVDLAGNLIYIDIEKGLVGRCCYIDEATNKKHHVYYISDENLIMFDRATVIEIVNALDVDFGISGEDSSKNNGYLYIDMVVEGEEEGTTKRIRYGKHNLVAMVAYMDEFDYYVEKYGTIPIPNHENNCPWDNRAGNLYYCTHAANIRHGNIIVSMWNYWEYEFVDLMMNRGTKVFLVSKQPVRISDMLEFEKIVEDSLGKTGIFNTGPNGLIDHNILIEFIGWLMITGRWKMVA